MKISLVLCHALSNLSGEIREAIVAKWLHALGHEVGIHRMWDGPALKRELFDDTVPVTFYPTDNLDTGPHDRISTTLLDAINSGQPDLVIFKGLDYKIVQAVIDRLDLQLTKIGFIVGGVAVGPVLKYASFVLTESNLQTESVRESVRSDVPIKILGKYINWDIPDQIYAATRPFGQRKFDIVNVGYFDKRKNQIELRRLFGHYRMALIGDGPNLAAVREAAANHPDVEFLGTKSNDDVLRIVSESRLMVHTSLWEGVPRVIIEAFACGTPAVAFDCAIQGDFGQTAAVRLVPREHLETAVAELLSDPDGLQEMSKRARQYALEHHGPERLWEAAADIVAFAEGRARSTAKAPVPNKTDGRETRASLSPAENEPYVGFSQTVSMTQAGAAAPADAKAVWYANGTTSGQLSTEQYRRLYEPFEVWNISPGKRHPTNWFWEGTIEALYSTILKPGSVAVDGGACLGRHTIPMAKIVGQHGRVYAFEPNSRNVMQLIDDLRLENLLICVNLRKAALADRLGVSTFYCDRKDPGRSSLAKLPNRPDLEAEEGIQLSTLDLELLSRPAAVPFVKLDLEGGEFHALRGGRNFLITDRPVVAFENNSHMQVFGYTVDDFFRLFRELNYDLYDISGIPLRPEFFEYLGFKPNYLLALPEEINQESILQKIHEYLGKSVPQFLDSRSKFMRLRL